MLCVAAGPVEVSNVWELSLDDRRRLVRGAARKRYESAMEDFKDSIKKYNMIREIYEVKRILISESSHNSSLSK